MYNYCGLCVYRLELRCLYRVIICRWPKAMLWMCQIFIANQMAWMCWFWTFQLTAIAADCYCCWFSQNIHSFWFWNLLVDCVIWWHHFPFCWCQPRFCLNSNDVNCTVSLTLIHLQHMIIKTIYLKFCFGFAFFSLSRKKSAHSSFGSKSSDSKLSEWKELTKPKTLCLFCLSSWFSSWP